jgi:predicted nucleic acid-binding protein
VRLVDSNIIIYAAEPKFHLLRRELLDLRDIAASDISYIEVVGFSRNAIEVQNFFECFFSSIQVYSISPEIVEKAVAIRKRKTISLGDSIIAGTALHYNLPLVTNNEKDFSWIEGLTIINPLKK